MCIRDRYTFENGEFTSTDLEGWTRTPVVGNYIYRIRRYITADASATSEAILNNEWSTPELFIRATVSYSMTTDGFDFVSLGDGDQTVSVTVTRSLGSTVEDITEDLNDHNVSWERESIRASFDDTAVEWVSSDTYSQGTIVQYEIVLASGQPVDLNFRALRDVAVATMPTTSTNPDWALTPGSRLLFEDAQWSFPNTASTEAGRRRRGVSITYNSAAVNAQSNFNPCLNDDLGPVP